MTCVCVWRNPEYKLTKEINENGGEEEEKEKEEKEEEKEQQQQKEEEKKEERGKERKDWSKWMPSAPIKYLLQREDFYTKVTNPDAASPHK